MCKNFNIPISENSWKHKPRRCEPWVEMALDTIGREFSEQGRVPDRVKSTQYVERYGSDFMSGTEYLHPLLGEQKQHIEGRVTRSETKLMIGKQAIGEEEGFNVWSDDGFHNIADDWEKADWSGVAGICFCTFFMQGSNVCWFPSRLQMTLSKWEGESNRERVSKSRGAGL